MQNLGIGAGSQVLDAIARMAKLLNGDPESFCAKDVQDLGFPGMKNLRKKELANLEKELSACEQKERSADTALKGLSVDIVALEQELKISDQDGKMPCKRAILIICENVHDAKKVEERIRKDVASQPGEHAVYRYDRAYRPFEKARLDAGDIVVATNIAGRGTDLPVSKQVERNGGLHVIMSFMPSNDRVRIQGLGRCARAGIKGTGTYIILCPGSMTKSVDEIMWELDDQENQRLLKIVREAFPKIKAESELLDKFSQVRVEIEGAFNDKDEKECKLQVASLQNKWALWLNEHEQLFNTAHVPGNMKKIYELFEEFANAIKQKLHNKYGLIDEPGELSKLGKLLLDSGKTFEASSCFQHIIQEHPAFSDIALCYQGLCDIHRDGGINGKRQAAVFFKKARASMCKTRSRILARIQIKRSIDKIAQRTKGGGTNHFDQQQKGEAQCLSKHIEAIDISIGAEEVTADHFTIPGAAGSQEQILQELRRLKLMKGPRFSKKLLVGSQVLKSVMQAQKCIESTKSKAQHKRRCEQDRDVIKILESKVSVCDQLLGLLAQDAQAAVLAPSNLWNRDCVPHLQEEDYRFATGVLLDAGVISEPELWRSKKTSGDQLLTELVPFPDVFCSAKQELLMTIERKLADSREKQWALEARQIDEWSFKDIVFSTEKFMKYTGEIVQKEERVQIDKSVSNKLAGKLEDEAFLGHGNRIREVLQKEVQKMAEQETQISESLKEKRQALEMESSEERQELQAEIQRMEAELRSSNGTVSKHQLVQALVTATGCGEQDVQKMLHFLEHHETVTIDHGAIQEKMTDTKNKSIFMGHDNAIEAFLLGREEVTVKSGRTVCLKDGDLAAKQDVQDGIRALASLKEGEEESNLKAILLQAGLDTGVKFEAVQSYRVYSFKQSNALEIISEALSKMPIPVPVIDSAYGIFKQKMQELSFSCSPALECNAHEIKEQLLKQMEAAKKDGKTELEVRKTSFELQEEEGRAREMEDEEFEILRALMQDAQIFQASLMEALLNKKFDEPPPAELERILVVMHQNDGQISERNPVLKDAQQASQELYARLRELGVILPERVHWRLSSDPKSREKEVKRKVEEVVCKVFSLKRQNDAAHQVEDWIAGGLSESKNKELDEKIEAVTNILKQVAGSMKTIPDVKVNKKTLSDMFKDGGKVPPEILEYVEMCFDQVIAFEEKRSFWDWNCFFVILIGVAQIVAGAALDVLTAGSAHYLAQGLISEGIGDITFAITSWVSGTFSWKAYGQHKVQSLMISLLTAGVGSLMGKGAQAAKMGVGLATKTAITKAIFKEVMVNVISGVADAVVSIGTEELSKVIMEELADVHFVKHFEEFLRGPEYEQAAKQVEEKIKQLYDTYGTDCKAEISACIHGVLQDLMSGTLGAKIFGQVSRVATGIGQGMSAAANKTLGLIGKSNSKMQVLKTTAKVTRTAVNAANYAKELIQLCRLSKDYLDHLEQKIASLDNCLAAKVRNGSYKVDAEKLAREKVELCFADLAREEMNLVDKQIREAFQAKIKQGFLQPAVQGLMNMAMKPVKEALTSPFTNAMDQFAEHCDQRSEFLQQQILAQNENHVAGLTRRQKKALQQRGEVLDSADFLKQVGSRSYEKLLDDREAVQNFKGQSLRALLREHGPAVKILFREGGLHVVLPTHKEMCDNLERGDVKVASNTHTVSVAAMKLGRPIELFTLKNGDIQPLTGTKSKFFPNGHPDGEAVKLAWFPGKGDEPGHYAPLIRHQDGKWQAIKISQDAGSRDACFAQSMLFAESYRRDKCEKKAMAAATTNDELKKYYRSLGRFARKDPNVKSMYLTGSSVKRNRVVGGITQGDLTEKWRAFLERRGGIRPELLQEMAEHYARHFQHAVMNAEITRNMKPEDMARFAELLGTGLADTGGPGTDSRRQELERRMRENIFQHNNLPVPPEPIDPMDRANLAPPVYGAINYLGDPHGGAPKYSGIAKARGTAPDPHGDSHFGHHFVYKPDSNHLLSYFPSDSLQLWSHGKFPISTTRQGLWNSLGPVSEEVMEKFMSMSRDSAQRGVYRQTNYLEVNIHRNQTPFGYEHISKVVMDHRDEQMHHGGRRGAIQLGDRVVHAEELFLRRGIDVEWINIKQPRIDPW